MDVFFNVFRFNVSLLVSFNTLNAISLHFLLLITHKHFSNNDLLHRGLSQLYVDSRILIPRWVIVFC